ncbi:hypothetical protein [Paenibacillus methanolicus]|uniref:Uncharacterized protein n=1 Tax=Paenibacillus methanolicus TaxID=582686 RepID=A0A5S5CKI8_9BACL|nr:hypothetical protein [Paenibacillus methanolicus]TYP79407.1 hypothetical protein BCM02_101525 [Paenibacillus methanolicus]
MKKALIISSLLAMTLLAACSSNSNITSPDTPNNPVAVDNQKETDSVVTLLDEEAYQGDELEVVKTINQRVTFYNQRNNEQYPTVFTKETVSGTDLEADKDNKTIITKLSDPKFTVQDDQITVAVHETYQDSPFGPEGDTLYTLKKVDEAWKIYGID